MRFQVPQVAWPITCVLRDLGRKLVMDRSDIEYMEQCSGDSQIAIGLRHMSKLNIGDFYLKSFAQSKLDQASSQIQGKAISWLKNDLKRIQRDFQKAKLNCSTAWKY